jgi:membrane-bound lytic murein transglycosylase D
MFECWYLAAASYNAGEGKISRAMKRYRTEDFWELTRYRYLKRETKNYVPQMIAAALVAKDPEKYGFTDIEYQEVLCYDKVTVPEGTDLGLIAKACEISLEEIKDLNPEILRECTPPGISDYEIRIPCGKKEFFQKNFEDLRPRHRFQFKTHVVKKGDTLSGIARIYRIALEPLLQINKLKKTSRLSVGMNLLIPVPISQHVSIPTAIEKAPKGKTKRS